MLTQRFSLWQRIILIIGGIIFCFIVMEFWLRSGAFLFSSLQEYNNKKAIYKKNFYRIMCIGESTTALGGEHSYPRQLETVLNLNKPGVKFSVINAGMFAVNTSYILLHLEENLNRYNPDMVIAMMGSNDQYIKYYENIPESETKFFKKFKTYKFFRLLWIHLVNKVADKNITRSFTVILPECYAEQNTTLLNSPENDVHIGLNSIRAGSNAYAKQEESFKKAIEINPNDDLAYTRLGCIYKKHQNFIYAEELFKKAIQINPRNDTAVTELAECYLTYMNRESEGLRLSKEAIALNPRNEYAYYLLGQYYLWIHDLPLAETYLHKVIEVNPHNGWMYGELVNCYRLQGKLLKAEQTLKEAIALNPSNEKLYRAISVIYREMGKDEAAKQYMRRANEVSLGYGQQTRINYLKLKETLDKRGIKLVCVQYPIRSVKPLKKLFPNPEGVIFVDNEKLFKKAVAKAGYRMYFQDMFAGDFGHCTPKGNRLLAENIAQILLKEYFRR